MKILADRKIKKFFCRAGMSILAFILCSAFLICFRFENAVLWIFLCSLCMALAILTAAYGYFREQNRIMEEAAGQITAYISGDSDARIKCTEEGQLYRLFHEVNMLAAILNAHAENEGRAREFLKETISDISHQLKTPLAALNIYNGILQEEAGNQPDIGEFLSLSEQELDRIEELVQNLLKIAKLDAGTIVPDKKQEDVAGMMECIKKRFRIRAAQEGKEILLEGKENVSLLCDGTWLMEAVGNLVKNALEHTKEGDCVRVQWERRASAIRITVRDNGSGIHPEDLYYIFKRFYRSRFSKDTSGTGLGLPLAKAIVEAHGGTVEVDSEPGRGSVFVMNFPEYEMPV